MEGVTFDKTNPKFTTFVETFKKKPSAGIDYLIEEKIV